MCSLELECDASGASVELLWNVSSRSELFVFVLQGLLLLVVIFVLFYFRM